MSFTVHYAVDRRPQQVLPDGREEFQEDAGRWALFEAAEQAREAAKKQPEDDVDGPAAAAAVQRTPQPVIDQLSAARGELDVILDLVTAVEQQQFMSLAHVQRARDPAAAARAAALRLARRRAQLRTAAERLRAGTAAAAGHARVADRFLADVAALRAQWRLSRRPRSAGGAFFVDLALPLPQDLPGIVELQRPEQTQVNIVPSAEGEACLVAATAAGAGAGVVGSKGPAAVEVIKGPAAIDSELQKRQMAHAWRVIEGLVAAEAAAQGRRDGSGAAAMAAADAVRRMAAAAAAKAIASNDAMDVDSDAPSGQVVSAASGAGGGQAAADLAAFCAAPGCQEQFEARALRCLAVLCRSARTPTLIKEAQSGFGGRGSNANILEQLASWLRHAALCHAVETSLAQQGATLERQEAPGALTAAWALSAGGKALGTLEVADDRLMWRGTPLPGVAGPQLGRRQLDTLVAAAEAAAVDA